MNLKNDIVVAWWFNWSHNDKHNQVAMKNLQIADRVFMWTKSKVKESTHVRVTFDHTSKFLYDDVLIDIRVDLCFAN